MVHGEHDFNQPFRWTDGVGCIKHVDSSSKIWDSSRQNLCQQCYVCLGISSWLPGDWNMFFSIFCMGMENNPKWRTQSMIFQRGSFTKNHQAASLCQMDEWMVRGIFFGMVNVNPGWTNSPSLSIGIRLVDWCLTFFQIGQVGDIRWPSLKTDLLSQYAWKMVGYDIAVPYITLTV